MQPTVIKGIVHPKIEFLSIFTDRNIYLINFFIVLKAKEDIIKNVGNQKFAGPHWWKDKNTMKVAVDQKLFGFPRSLKLHACSAEERHSFRFKTTFEWVNDGINIKHYDRIDRQMTEFLFLGKYCFNVKIINIKNEERKITHYSWLKNLVFYFYMCLFNKIMT